MLKLARLFFSDRSILEVDTPILGKAAPIDEHIDVMHVLQKNDTIGFLHTSPEYAMKRLLVDGIGDIYQISHVFRDGEVSSLHNPEFCMVEWYRVGKSFAFLKEETLSFIQLFLGNRDVCCMSYKELFQNFASIDCFQASSADLLSIADEHGVSYPNNAKNWEIDTLLQFLMSFVIEPKLKGSTLFVVEDFPVSQSALAQVIEKQGQLVAQRFEIFFQGIELANGYFELTDAKEQRKRFEEASKKRQAVGKRDLVIDEKFLQALEKGLPKCCGVAVGFDRLMLLRHQKSHIQEVLPISWEEL